jgi:hypothetical protein
MQVLGIDNVGLPIPRVDLLLNPPSLSSPGSSTMSAAALWEMRHGCPGDDPWDRRLTIIDL